MPRPCAGNPNLRNGIFRAATNQPYKRTPVLNIGHEFQTSDDQDILDNLLLYALNFIYLFIYLFKYIICALPTGAN